MMNKGILLGAMLFCSVLMVQAAETNLRVMSYNIYRGGTMNGQPLDLIAKVIREAQADIGGVQETRSPREITAEPLAKLLGWNLAELP